MSDKAKVPAFLTDARRDFIQRVMLNFASITLGAAYASNFFTLLQMPARIVVWSLVVFSVAGGLWIKKGEE